MGVCYLRQKKKKPPVEHNLSTGDISPLYYKQQYACAAIVPLIEDSDSFTVNIFIESNENTIIFTRAKHL